MIQKIQWYGKEVTMKIHDKSMGSIIKCCNLVESDCKKSMKKGSGRLYLIGQKKNIKHYASAPGEPPAVLTGRLRASITSNWYKSGKANADIQGAGKESKSSDGVGQPDKDWTGVVGTNVEYAKALELGDPDRKLKPRPYLRPALERQKGKFQSYFSNLI